MTIPVRPDTPVASWARWTARGRIAPVDALEVGGRRAAAFVPGHLLVDDEDGLVDHLVETYGARVVEPAPLPPPPEGMGPREGVDLAAMPMPVLLELPETPPPSERAGALLRERADGEASVTSDRGAGLLGLALELAADGRPAALDLVGQTCALPLLTAVEGPFGGGGLDAFTIAPYGAPARVHEAWQLVEAFRTVRSLKPLVTVGVLDGGFWLDGKAPAVTSGQPGSDFGTGVIQVNLLDERVGAGGANPNKCGAPPGNPFASAYTCPWHGNAVASVATAPVGNGLGAAGVGGTVAEPVLFKTDLAQGQVLRCLQLCVAWGIDVVNMSFTIETPLFMFTSKGWDAMFRFAADNGVVIVVAAGNDGERLPDLDVRPATRTPGTITVGALTGSAPRGDSNFGSSINVWAPGTGLPVMPDANNPGGSSVSGTSVAAPVVSGVAAMMRAVAPSLSTQDIRRILTETAWPLTPPAEAGGVDAYAAVLSAMGGRLPDDASEPNADPGSARPLQASGPGGRHLQPLTLDGRPLAALSGRDDEDWYRFDVADFADLDLRCSSYPLLGPVLVTLEPDDADARSDEVLDDPLFTGGTRLVGPIAPGSYKIHVRGSTNLYELTVDLGPMTLLPDEFEANDTIDTAARIRLRDPRAPAEPIFVLGVPGGTWDLTMHDPADADWFRVDAATENPLARPVVRLSRSDVPMDIDVFDSDRQRVDGLAGQRQGLLVLDRAGVTFVSVSSGGRPTRYRLSIRLEVDESLLPGPQQEQALVPVPDAGDPAFGLLDEVSHAFLELDDERRALGRLVLGTVEGRPLRAELLDRAGTVLQTAETGEADAGGLLELDVGGLELGGYLLRLSAASVNGDPLHVEVVPSYRR
jgi:hypothetical protein